MTDDIVALLTQEVKEDIIENYLYERRLIEEQVKYIEELAAKTAQTADELCKRFARIYELLVEPEFIDRFVRLLGLTQKPFATRFSNCAKTPHSLRFIKVLGLTRKTKFKKLLTEAYRRLYAHHRDYKKKYGELEAEVQAVNRNLKKFEAGFDLMTILNFLKDMDVEGLDRKRWLGDNFTPQEVGAIEDTLRFRPVRLERFKLPPLFDLPEPQVVESELHEIARCAFGECSGKIEQIMR